MIFSMFFGTQRSTLGALTLDVLLKEQLTLPSEVTQYPVEDGGPEISDHITQGTEKLEISGSVSGTLNIEAFEFGSCSSRMMDAIDTLRMMHTERATITVVTGLGVYEDMGLNGVTIARNSGNDKGGSWLDIDATLIKVIKVSLEEADLPEEQVSDADGDGKGSGMKGKSGKSGKSAGKSTGKEPSKGNGSALIQKLESEGKAPDKDYWKRGSGQI